MIDKQFKVLVTGGSGFIGTNLVSFFSEQGHVVINFDIIPPRNPNHYKYWEKVDIRNRDQLINKFLAFQPHALLHFAARTDLNEEKNLGGYDTNISGVCNVIDAIRGTLSIERVVFASSQLVCRLGIQPKDEYDYQPTTLYGQSKVLTERIIRSAKEIGATWIIVRPTSLWGPWFDVPYKNFFTTIKKNLYVHAKGVQTMKQWGYVGNSVYQINQLLHAPLDAVHGRTLYLADYEPVEMRKFADMVAKAMGTGKVRTVPEKLLKTVAIIGDGFQRLGWKNPPLSTFRLNNIVTSEVQDLEPLRAIVGALPYSLQEGIEQTVHWMAEEEKD